MIGNWWKFLEISGSSWKLVEISCKQVEISGK